MINKVLDGNSKDIISDNVSKLKEIFPEIVLEDKIDFDELKLILGEEINDSRERYSFTWPGKTQAIKESQKQSNGTLRPCNDESKNWDTTQNLYIEGDNLEVLKLLQKGYYNKIKAIYIDPPYNTGKDFIYPDNYHDNLVNYLKISGQILDSKGERERESIGIKLTNNPETAGRYHSNWLNMMYPRLKLARNLLSDDGAIFISIDDNEIENLKRLCEEIFGEENFVGCIIRGTGTTTGQDANKIGSSMDYLLVYRKSENFILNGIPLSDKDLTRFKDKDEKGLYSTLQLRKTGNADKREDRPSMYYPVFDPNGNEVYPIGPGGYESRWRVGKDTYTQLLEDGMIIWKNNNQGILNPYVKYYAEGRTKKVSNLWNDIDGNKKGSLELKELFGDKIFDNPKPTQFLELILSIVNVNDNDIILDFFSGTATTAHASFKYNIKNNKSIKFIMIQIPEDTNVESNAYKMGFINICEIGKERIRRAGDKILEESNNKDLDIGFKVFKLDSSNLEKWDPDYNNLQQSLTIDNIKEGRTNEDLVYEIMLKYGIDLTYPIEQMDNIYSIGFGALIVCLDNNITKDITNQILKFTNNSSTSRVVFKDSGFKSDADKTNIKEILKTNNIDEFITI